MQHQPVLKAEFAQGVGSDAGLPALVRRRQNAVHHTERVSDLRSNLGKPLPRREPLRSEQVEREVAVAEQKPTVAAELPHGLEQSEALRFAPPAPLLGRKPGERVGNSVEVRADPEPPVVEVIACVDDDRQLLRAELSC